jgi:5-methylcytosine-specific restriction endonuclease McrA
VIPVAPREPRLSAYQRGYTKRWAAYSRVWKQTHPWCGERLDYQLHGEHSRCVREGRLTGVIGHGVTDHIRPHRGDDTRFWDVHNHQSLCVSCHNAKSQQEGEDGRGGQFSGDSRRETAQGVRAQNRVFKKS